MVCLGALPTVIGIAEDSSVSPDGSEHVDNRKLRAHWIPGAKGGGVGAEGSVASGRNEADVDRFEHEAKEHHALGSVSSEVLADAEAFLCGAYCDLLRLSGAPIPGWAQLNALAHGDVRSLRRIRRGNRTKDLITNGNWSVQSWVSARRVLAGEIMAMVDGDPEELSSVQRHILIPLEFRLMRERDLTAYGLMQFTRAALRSAFS